MKEMSTFLTILFGFLIIPMTVMGQNLPTGNPKDFKVKTCLHSVSYAGVWRGQARLSVDDFLVKAKEFGYDGVMLVAKRPHVSPFDYDETARKRLKARIEELGLELVCLAGYTDFTAGSDSTGTVFQPVTVELITLPNPFTYTDSDGVERTITYTSGPNEVKALQFYNIAQGHTVYVTFKKKFLDVRDYNSDGDIEDTTLAEIGLETEYEPIVMAGVAAQLISGRDIPAATVENITQNLQLETFPVGAAANVRNSLLRYQQVLITQARKNLRAKYPEAVVINGVSTGSQ